MVPLGRLPECYPLYVDALVVDRTKHGANTF
jgi:hypothetical protein